MKTCIILLSMLIICAGQASAQIMLLDSMKLKSKGVDMEIYQDTLLYVASHNIYTPGYVHNRPDAGAINIIGDTLVMIPGYSVIDAHIISSRTPAALRLTDSLVVGGNADDFLYYDLAAGSSIALRDLSQATGISQDISTEITENGDPVTVITNVPDGFRIITNTFQSGTQALNRGFYGVEIHHQRIYAGADDSTLVTFDLAGNVFTDTLNLPGIAKGIAALDTLLFCATGGYVTVLSISDPLHPRELQTVAINGRANDVIAAENRMYVVSGDTDSTSVNAVTVISGDAGWKQFNTEGEIRFDTPVWGMEVDPRNHDIFYAVTDDSILYALSLGEVNRIVESAHTGVQDFCLDQNYPNPFNPTTEISWQLAVAGHMELSVYDLLGRKVATLVSQKMEAGRHTYRFDGTGLASGVYISRLTTEGRTLSRKMILLR